MPAARRYYIFRHGSTLTDKPRFFSGGSDVPLAPEGRRQSARIVDLLASLGVEAVWSSDLARARETAMAAAARAGVPHRVLGDLGEIRAGAWEGLTFEEASARFPREAAAYLASWHDFAFPGGEGFASLFARALAAFEDVRGATSGRAGIVTHSGVIRAIAAGVLGADAAAMMGLDPAYGSMTRIDEAEDGRLYLRSFGVVSHLE